MWPISKRAVVFGFTLIEIMVVISIIGILIGIVSISFNTARMNSRDGARRAAVKQLQLAIETYKAQNGRYPAAGCSVTYPQWAGSEANYTGSPSVTACFGNYIVGLAPDYIPSLPSEPGPTKTAKGFAYRVSADGSTYKLISHHNVESQRVSGFGDEFARFPSPTYSGCPATFTGTELDVYAVYSKGAECW